MALGGKMREDLCQVMGAGCKGEAAPKSQPHSLLRGLSCLPTESHISHQTYKRYVTYPQTHNPPHGRALPELSGAQGPACVSQPSSHSQLVLEPKNMLL